MPTTAIHTPVGWVRNISQDEITYESPDGHILKSLLEVHDYVKSSNTCKCGLPCPLDLNLYFSFDSRFMVKNNESIAQNRVRYCRHRKSLNRWQNRTDWPPPVTHFADASQAPSGSTKRRRKASNKSKAAATTSAHVPVHAALPPAQPPMSFAAQTSALSSGLSNGLSNGLSSPLADPPTSIGPSYMAEQMRLMNSYFTVAVDAPLIGRNFRPCDARLNDSGFCDVSLGEAMPPEPACVVVTDPCPASDLMASEEDSALTLVEPDSHVRIVRLENPTYVSSAEPPFTRANHCLSSPNLVKTQAFLPNDLNSKVHNSSYFSSLISTPSSATIFDTISSSSSISSALPTFAIESLLQSPNHSSIANDPDSVLTRAVINQMHATLEAESALRCVNDFSHLMLVS